MEAAGHSMGVGETGLNDVLLANACVARVAGEVPSVVSLLRFEVSIMSSRCADGEAVDVHLSWR